MTVTHTYYRIRFNGPCGYNKAGDYYSSNNGTSEWSTMAHIKSLLTRGIPTGYKGRNRSSFVNYDIVEVTDIIQRIENIVTL